jgi:hypothetical protein
MILAAAVMIGSGVVGYAAAYWDPVLSAWVATAISSRHAGSISA